MKIKLFYTGDRIPLTGKREGNPGKENRNQLSNSNQSRKSPLSPSDATGSNECHTEFTGDCIQS